MSSLFFIIRRQLKNIIRGLAHKPLALIGYILAGLFMIGLFVLVLIMPAGIVRHGSNELFSAIFTGLVIIALYLSLKQGIEKGSTYFRLSDVNLVFTSPFKPSNVLLYGFIKHMGTSLLVILFMICQLPNIKNNFMLQDYGAWLILLAALLYSLLYPIIGMALYIFTSVSAKRRTIAKRVLDVLILAFAVGFLINVLEKQSLPDAAIDYLNRDFFAWLPLVGQLRTIVSSAVYGISPAFWFSIIILTAVIALFLIILYRSDMDYYEDVLAATEQKEQLIMAKRQGRDGSLAQRKSRKVKGGFSSMGARAILDKSLLEYRKSSYFLFFDKSSLIIVIAAIAFSYFMPERQGSIFAVLYLSAYMLFFFISQGKWPMEMEKHYIFLIPESNGKKLLYMTLPENIKNLFDGILLFTIGYFCFNTTLPVIMVCIVCYTLYGAVYIYADIVSRRLFGSVHSKAMQIFTKLFVSFIVIVPGIILMGIASFLLKNELVAVTFVALWNALVALCLFLASKGIFNNLEVAS